MSCVVSHSLFCVVCEPACKLLCRPSARECLMLFHLLLYRFQINFLPAFLRDFSSELYRESVGCEEHKGVNVVAHLLQLAHPVRECLSELRFFSVKFVLVSSCDLSEYCFFNTKFIG